MDNIFNEIREERTRQNEKFGEQNYPILDQMLLDRDSQRMCDEYEIPNENRARYMVETHNKRGDLTWMHILMEEVSEVASCGRDTEALRKELVQVASVVVAMIESLDRNNR